MSIENQTNKCEATYVAVQKQLQEEIVEKNKEFNEVSKQEDQIKKQTEDVIKSAERIQDSIVDHDAIIEQLESIYEEIRA